MSKQASHKFPLHQIVSGLMEIAEFAIILKIKENGIFRAKLIWF